jgi:hypothetical protein
MHPQFTLIAAQQRIADLQRAADRHRLVHIVTTATCSRSVPLNPATPLPGQSRSGAGSARRLASTHSLLAAITEETIAVLDGTRHGRWEGGK